MHLHSRDHAGSEYVSYARVDRRGAEFIANKHTNNFTHSLTHRHSTFYGDYSSIIIIIIFISGYQKGHKAH